MSAASRRAYVDLRSVLQPLSRRSMNVKHLLVALAATAGLAVAAIGIAAADSGKHRNHGELAEVVAATARFHDVGVANNEGYSVLKDTAGIACIEMTGMPSMGAMGIHFV